MARGSDGARRGCSTLALVMLVLAPSGVAAYEPGVTIEYIAHAAFRLVAADGSSLVIDPYADRIWLSYDFPEGVEADGWLVSHPHYDHDGGDYRGRKPPWPPGSRVLRFPGEFEIGPFRITGIRGRHAEPYGEDFGRFNTVWKIEVGGLTLAHWGDNEPLTDDMATALTGVDVLLLPIDDLEHLISFAAVDEIVHRLEPAILIPMHYRHPDLEPSADTPSDLGGIEGWLRAREPVVRVGTDRLELSRRLLPVEGTAIYVLDHSPAVQLPLSRD